MARARTTKAKETTTPKKTTKPAVRKVEAAAKKPVKKTAPRKTTPVVSEQPVEKTHTETQPETPVQKAGGFQLRKSYLITALAILLLGALLYLLRGEFFVASVNGQLVSKAAFYKELEMQGGKRAYDALITKRLIEQEAAKEHVTVSQSEVNADLKKLEDQLAKQGQKLDTVLATNGMTRDSLMDQLRLQKLVDKMVGKDVTVTDQEVNDYIQKNKDSLPQTEDQNAQKESVRNSLKQQKLNDKIQSWLADLRSKAKIVPYDNF